ncbi:hypothetical protein PR202_ga00236 [Eleusine coracana subsp. coracana]|uniref:Terpene synthase metal-binding domain-containing protein n=1 Tax=Eleusine coracana subsp. coracana TaxID=191504 RepID=A0AAV5BBV0_ELECO|nr:hypothetical protein PR202_ga00236 [Eleusine coracana subsp. coracana]
MVSSWKSSTIPSCIGKAPNLGGNQQKPSHTEGPTTKENHANFHPSIWGDFFLHYSNPATTRKQIVDVVRAYNMEVKWRDQRYVPPTVEEHLQVSARSGACHLLSCASFIGMGEIVTKESFDWASSMPKMVKALCIILRLSDDLKESYEQEKVILDVASIVDSCMKEHNASVESARKMIKGLIEEAWKSVNEEWLKPDNTEPKELLERIFNLTRTIEYMYSQEDALTTSHAVKDTINSLFVESFTDV